MCYMHCMLYSYSVTMVRQIYVIIKEEIKSNPKKGMNIPNGEQTIAPLYYVIVVTLPLL